MHRRIWPLAGTVAAVLLLAASASATTSGASSRASSALAAAPFAQAWAHVPRTPAARKAKSVLVFGMEQDVTGFNTLNADQNAYWAAITGNTPVIRGTYIIDNNGEYHLDLASKVTATKSSLTITIRPDAYWYWGGKKLPVTYKDYVYTWQQIVNPNNTPASTTGYELITGFTHKGQKQVTFKWKKPFADYRDLFGLVLPSQAVKGLDFDTMWSNCVCGYDGKPVSDGPFYVANYTKGQGLTLKPNPYWYGKKPALKEVDFKLITDTNSEIQAMRGGEVDAINPSPQAALAQLINQKGVTYSAVPSYTQEHIDINVGKPANPLLKQLWFRQAIAQSIYRQDLVKALFGEIAPKMKPLDNPIWNIGPNAKPWFKQYYPFSQKKAIQLFKQHGCTGGPSAPSAKNTAVWTCNGQKAEFRFTTTAGNQRRQTSAAIFSQQLMAVGIKLDVNFQPANPTYFGQTLPNHDFDIAEFAWIGGPDPSGFDDIYRCPDPAKNIGGSNYKLYCNKTVDQLIAKGQTDLNPTSRTATYQKVAQILSKDIAIIPLYASPQILVYKSAVKGMDKSNNPTLVGPTWNIEEWHW
ncbi:MAG: peptide ABC transporter substrate-binding protein [Rhodospirillales bacterium]|nr:peptide ABC transporter substrate-binding protein [Rhodospirillales bacterium]